MFHQAQNFHIKGGEFLNIHGNYYKNESEGYKEMLTSKLQYSAEAFYDADNGIEHAKSSCTPGTRVEILNKIGEWIDQPQSMGAQGYWLCGMAGTGKSTIAKSVCEILAKKQLLAGTFFCSRQIPGCSKYQRIIPTIAYQLSRFSLVFDQALKEELKENPDLATKYPEVQIDLIVKPWKKVVNSNMSRLISPVVVIDALDECHGVNVVLDALTSAIQRDCLPGLKFFLTSRPEKNVPEYFTTPLQNLQIARFFLHNVEMDMVERDIIIFLQEKLGKISSISEKNIRLLAKRSGKLFIYAATMAKWITARPGLVKERLAWAISLTESSDPNQTKGLDVLYDVVVNNAIPSSDEVSYSVHGAYLRVLHTAIMVGQPVSCKVIAKLLNCKLDLVEETISNLESVLYIAERDQNVYIFHSSFADYISSQSRAKKLYCDAMQHHTLLCNACFTIMQRLRFNMAELPSSFIPDKDVLNIEDKIADAIDDVLHYCCRYWGYHLTQSSLHDTVIGNLKEFLGEKVIYWVEAMSLLGITDKRKYQKKKNWETCMQILQSVGNLIQDRALTTIEADISSIKEMVETFTFSSVNGITPHLYLSIFPFWADRLEALGRLKSTLKVENKRKGSQVGKWMTGSHVLAVSVSPNGRTIVSGSSDNTIRLWNAQTGEAIGEPFQGHTERVRSVAFSPDGERIVSGSFDKTIRLWNAQTGEAIGDPFQGHTEEVQSVAFSPDGEKIVSGSSDKTIRLWNAQTGEAIGEPFQGHTDWVWSAVFSPDGGRIVSGSDDKTVRLWKTQTGEAICEPLQGHTKGVWSVAFSPDGKRIVSGSFDKTIRMWNAQTRETISEPYQGHKGRVLYDALFVSEFDDETILWNPQVAEAIGEPFWGHTEGVQSVAFSPDGEKIISGSCDKTMRLWNAHTGEVIGEPFQGHTDWVWSVAFFPDGQKIVSGSDDKTMRLWDAQTGEAISEPLQGHEEGVQSVAFAPDGKRIVSGSFDKTIRLWNAQTGEAIGEPFQGHSDWVWSVSFSPDGQRIVSGSFDKTIRLWNAQTGQASGKPFQGHTGSVWSVAFSPDGQRIVSGSSDKTIRLWNAQTGEAIGRPFQGHTDWVWPVAFSPNGERIASGSCDKTIRLWNAHTGKVIGEPFQGHTDWVWSVAFSPDGQKIVSGSFDKTIRLWNAQTGETIGESFQGYTDWVWCLAFSLDGDRIVSGSDDKTTRLWDGKAIDEPFQCHTESILSVAFSPDAGGIIPESGDETLLWNPQAVEAIGEPFWGCQEGLYSVAFSPDKKKIVAASENKTIRVYNIRNIFNTTYSPARSSSLSPHFSFWKLNQEGWIDFRGLSNHILWIPEQYRRNLVADETLVIISPDGHNRISFKNVVFGDNWAKCWATD